MGRDTGCWIEVEEDCIESVTAADEDVEACLRCELVAFVLGPGAGDDAEYCVGAAAAG